MKHDELDYMSNTSELIKPFFRLFAARVIIELPSTEVTFERVATAESEKVSIWVSLCLLFSMSLHLLNLSHWLTNVNAHRGLQV